MHFGTYSVDSCPLGPLGVFFLFQFTLSGRKKKVRTAGWIIAEKFSVAVTTASALLVGALLSIDGSILSHCTAQTLHFSRHRLAHSTLTPPVRVCSPSLILIALNSQSVLFPDPKLAAPLQWTQFRTGWILDKSKCNLSHHLRQYLSPFLRNIWENKLSNTGTVSLPYLSVTPRLCVEGSGGMGFPGAT